MSACRRLTELSSSTISNEPSRPARRMVSDSHTFPFTSSLMPRRRMHCFTTGHLRGLSPPVLMPHRRARPVIAGPGALPHRLAYVTPPRHGPLGRPPPAGYDRGHRPELRCRAESPSMKPPCRLLALSALTLALVASFLDAQAPPAGSPKLDPVQPLGVRRGSALDLTLTGTGLADALGLWVSIPAKADL